MSNRLVQYFLLIRLHRPVGIFLLLWPTLWALWLSSDGTPQQIVFLVFVTGVLLLRSAGCALNDFADRKIDSLVARTHSRPLASGALYAFEVLIVASVLIGAAFALVLLLNNAAIGMSFVALLLAATYPYTKRWFAMPQLFLGIAFGFAIPMVWVAQNATFPPLFIWLLYLAVVCWSIAYDTIYALMDREDDIRANIKSAAIFFGRYDLLAVGFFHVMFLLLLTWAVQMSGATGLSFYLSLFIATAIVIWQLWLASKRTNKNYLAAFNANAWLGGFIFAGIFVDRLPSI